MGLLLPVICAKRKIRIRFGPRAMSRMRKVRPMEAGLPHCPVTGTFNITFRLEMV